MSKWSGTSDCYDSLIVIQGYTEEELKNNVKIYINKGTRQLQVEKMSDLIPYYPYVIYCSYHNNEDRESVVYLSSESSVDVQERRLLESYMKQILDIYNKCKKKNTEFNVEDVVKRVCVSNYSAEQVTELANRVKENGDRATFDGVHFYVFEHYRQELVDEMIKNNIDPTDYGYERFVKTY